MLCKAQFAKHNRKWQSGRPLENARLVPNSVSYSAKLVPNPNFKRKVIKNGNFPLKMVIEFTTFVGHWKMFEILWNNLKLFSWKMAFSNKNYKTIIVQKILKKIFWSKKSKITQNMHKNWIFLASFKKCQKCAKVPTRKYRCQIDLKSAKIEEFGTRGAKLGATRVRSNNRQISK